MGNYKNQQKIAERLVSHAIKEGYTVELWNGGNHPEVKKSTDPAAFKGQMGATEQDTLVLYRKDGTRLGFVALIFGNEDDELIADNADHEELNTLLDKFTQKEFGETA